MADNKDINTQDKLSLILEAIKEKKGKQIVSINLIKVHNSISDYFVICHAESTTQVNAIADAIQEKVKKESGEMAHHVEGKDNSQWVLIDYFDILVHIFLEEKRSFFNLEELWADGEIEQIEDEK